MNRPEELPEKLCVSGEGRAGLQAGVSLLPLSRRAAEGTMCSAVQTGRPAGRARGQQLPRWTRP